MLTSLLPILFPQNFIPQNFYFSREQEQEEQSKAHKSSRLVPFNFIPTAFRPTNNNNFPVETFEPKKFTSWTEQKIYGRVVADHKRDKSTFISKYY